MFQPATLLGMEKWAERIKDAIDRDPRLSMPGLARACGVKPPSIHQWFNETPSKPTSKMITGANLVAAARYIGLTPEEIMTGVRGASQPQRLTGEMLASAYRMARQTLRSQGQEPETFDPEANEIDAAIFAEAVETVISRGLLSDRDELDFVVETGGKYAGRFNRQDGGIGGSTSQHEAGKEAKTSRGRKRASR